MRAHPSKVYVYPDRLLQVPDDRLFRSASLYMSIGALLRTGVGRDTSRTEDESAMSEQKSRGWESLVRKRRGGGKQGEGVRERKSLYSEILS